MAFSPSIEQAAFLKAVATTRTSIVLEAVAGSGKTSTIMEAARNIHGGCAILAYNRKIANEIKEKLEKSGINWKQAQANTVHGFGFNAYRKAFPGVVLDENKVQRMAALAITEVQNEFGEEAELGPYIGSVCKLVGYAKQACLGVTRDMNKRETWEKLVDHYDVDFGGVPSGRGIADARGLLLAGIKETSIIDFDDMIYMPLKHDVRFWQFETVFLDEAQDTNDARRELCKRLIRPGGRLIAVGDPHQAIYGFTGADSDSLDIIRREFNAVVMPLSVTFRCPKHVVAFAQQWVSHIHAAPGSKNGSVGRTSFQELLANPDRHASTAILCRNVAPMIAVAMALIRNGVSCRVEGREIGKNLLKIINRWKVRSLDAFESRLQVFDAAERKALDAKKASDAKVQAHEDKIETIRTLVDQCRERGQLTVDDLRAAVENLFADEVSDRLVLSTVHKSKGREWPHVIMLDREEIFRISCQRAQRTPWQIQQEHNLVYVAATRSLDTLDDMVSASLTAAPGPGARQRVAVAA